MTDAEILEAIKRHNLQLGMHPPLCLAVMGDGMVGYRQPETLTYYGENLMNLCRELTGHK